MRGGNQFYKDENYKEALRCWEKSSSLNNIEAILLAANPYYEGKEKLPRDPAKALILYKKAAYRFKHTFSQYKIGLMYFQGDGVRQSFNHARTYFQAATDSDHSGARLALANLYYTGQGVEKNFYLALKYFEDHPKGLLGIARLYRDGYIGFTQNRIAAMNYYEKAYDKGDKDACYELACLYSVGIFNREPSYKIAMNYLTANKDHVDSIVKIGLFYLHGHSVEVNIDTATHYFQIALGIDREHGLENYYIAKCFIKIDTGCPDVILIKYFIMASYSHNSEASYWLGQYNESIDVEEAVHWYKKAIADGPNELAKAALLRLKPNTTTVPIERSSTTGVKTTSADGRSIAQLETDLKVEELVSSAYKTRFKECEKQLELKEKERLKTKQETKEMLELKEKEQLRTEQESKEMLEMSKKERLRIEQESKEKDEQIRLLTIEKEKMQQFQMHLVLNMTDDRNHSSKRRKDAIDY